MRRSCRTMSSTINLVMTICGFVVSAVFMIIVLIRLICARLRTRSFRHGWALRAAIDSISQIERGGNGMDPVIVALFPTIKFNPEVFASKEDAMCTVCLEEYEDTEILRILPQCGHVFHVKCIDAWLIQQSTCPVCREYMQNSPIGANAPSPLLSEAARSRFSPGTIPESLFEQSLLYINSPAATVGEGSPDQDGNLNRFQAYHHDSDTGDLILQMPDMQESLENTESGTQIHRLASGGQESEEMNNVVEKASDDYSQGTKNFLCGQGRDLEQQRQERYDFQLWRLEKGTPGSEADAAEVYEEKPKIPFCNMDVDESIGEVETGNAFLGARISIPYQTAVENGGTQNFDFL